MAVLSYSQTLNTGDTGDVIKSKVDTSLSEIRTAVNGIDAANITDGSITTAEILDGTISDTDLASPNNSVYRLAHAQTSGIGGAVAGTYSSTSAGAYAISGATTVQNNPIPLFYFLPADFTVASKTTYFRVRMVVTVGSTSPSTVVFTAGLYPVTVSAGNYTLGTVVTGSTVASSGLTTNNNFKFDTSDFAASALSSGSSYALGVVVSSITAPTGIDLNLRLDMRHA
jgi:hypothetical protein